MIYTIHGDPIALARAVIGGRFKKHLYNSQLNAQLITGITLKNQHGDLPTFDGPLKLQVIYYIQIPPRNGRKKQPLDYHESPPDNSNLVKFLEDVCQKAGIIKNDCRIAWLDSVKVWDYNPRLEFTLVELPRKHNKKIAECNCGKKI